MKIKKKQRNIALADFYKAHPALTYEAAGTYFNLTKQRAYQILIYNHSCHNCSRRKDSHCLCRDAIDIITKINKCPDWRPLFNGGRA